MSQEPEVTARTEMRDGMRITWHQPIEMDDGIVLRAGVYRPIADGRYPVILSYGVYAKGLAYQDGYPMQWVKMVGDHPEILVGSTNKYQNWETTDPERWVPPGYTIVRVDSRGASWSPGVMDPSCPREIDDLYRCIEWAGTEPWSNGKVGMLGISYYASNQWRYERLIAQEQVDLVLGPYSSAITEPVGSTATGSGLDFYTFRRLRATSAASRFFADAKKSRPDPSHSITGSGASPDSSRGWRPSRPARACPC